MDEGFFYYFFLIQLELRGVGFVKMTGGEAIVKSLEAEGVDIVFGYPGGAILPVYDSLRDSNIHHVLVRNEQAAAHAANGYARITGRVGVCLATSGPGATNLITGIATAYMDSIPIVAITGQVPTEMIGRDVFQEADITGATEPFCKHNYLVRNTVDIPRVIKEAFYIASTGRPGPVLIDIPQNIASGCLNFSYPDTVDLKGYKPNYKGHYLQIKRVVNALSECKCPVICVGGGAITSNAHEEVLKLAERLQARVATTLMGIGAFPGSHPLFLGMLGMHGSTAANKGVKEADLLLVLGARIGDRAIGNGDEFGKSATIIHIDIDPAEIGKNVSTDIPIVGDLKNVLKEVLKYPIERHTPNSQEKFCKDDKISNKKSNVGVCPQELFTKLSEMADKDTVLVTDVGQHQMWAGQYYKVESPRTFITSGGLGTMGYGLPAAIGAKLANPDKEVVLVVGDGGFQMSFSELATAVQENLNIKIILINNSSLGMVRELQQHYYHERYFSVHMSGNPDFIKLAQAYGIKGIRVKDNSEVEGALKDILKSNAMVLGEFIVDPNENVIPVKGGDGIL